MVPVYTFTAILSAFLVFFIQPVVAKLALPVLGGVPAVWNGCMLFFQATLLCGYLYANVLTNRVRIRFQPFIHAALLMMAVAMFPMRFDGAGGMEPSIQPMAWLLGMLVFSVGMPFFAISATAPLLQRWFSHTDHKDADNPYFLYAASNIGSMAALLLYPFAVEPFFELSRQIAGWETGVGVLAVLFIAVGALLLKREKQQVIVEPAYDTAAPQQEEHITWARRGQWILYSAVPASLLYGVTTYLTTDIAPIPFLWVLPLALYLITFIIVFSSWGAKISLPSKLHVPLVGALFLLLGLPLSGISLLVVHVAVYFCAILSVHAQLAQNKPTTRHLTEYFLWMSLGGVLGGMFNTLLAYHLFDRVTEYPLALLASCLLLSPARELGRQLRRHMPLIAFCTAVIILCVVGTPHLQEMYRQGELRNAIDMLKDAKTAVIVMVEAVVIGIILLRFRQRQALFVLCIATLYITVNSAMKLASGDQVLFRERSIFSTYNVQRREGLGAHLLTHGVTLHGIQSLQDDQRLQPAAYYGGLADTIRALTKEEGRVALVGLGTGALSCSGKSGQSYDLYEIDPVMVKIASDARFFTYLRDCPPEKRIILGDGRLQLAGQPDGFYDVIVVDAFNSDSIPIHLITLQAVELYREKLKPGGLLFLHISNRYIDLRPVLSSIGQVLEMPVLVKKFEGSGEGLHFPSVWVALTLGDDHLQALEGAEWARLDIYEARSVWKDSYSNIFTSLVAVRKYMGWSK